MVKIISINAKGRCELYDYFHKNEISYEVKKNVITTSFAKIIFLKEANVTEEILQNADIICGFVFNKKPLRLAEDTGKYIFERVDILVRKIEKGNDVKQVFKVCMEGETIKLVKTIVPNCDLETKLNTCFGTSVKYLLTEKEARAYVCKLTEETIKELEAKIEFLKKQKFEMLFE